MSKRIYVRTDPVKRFWDKVELIPFHSCWEWVGSATKGYGKLLNGRLQLAHRVSWEMHRGPIPEGVCVLHRCDNPGCVNPDHLFLGTKADNNRDMVSKGRARKVRGSSHPRAKLSAEQVLVIRSRWPETSQGKLAIEFGVSPTVVGRIIHRRIWAHI